MKNNRIKRIVMLMVLSCILAFSNVKAASISGNSNVYVGDTITITFNFDTNVGGYDSLNVSYDSNVFEYVSGDSLNESVWWDSSDASNGIRTKSYTFKAKKAGSSRIAVISNGTVSANDAMDYLGTVSAEKLINVNERAVEQAPAPAPEPENNYTYTQPSNSNTASGNNFLKYLQISEEGMSPYFSRNNVDYSLTVGENVNSIEVLARAEDANARVEITGNENLHEGDNEINIKVTAQNGYYRIYTILVTKAKDVSKANAFLGSLIVEGFNLDKKFQSETLEYDIGEVLTTIDKLNVVATAKDQDAKVEIAGADKLKVGGHIVVKVTAPDGTTTKEYKIKYTYKEATEEQIASATMKEYLKDVQNSQGKKEKAVAMAKYVWAAVKKNYLLVLMYALILMEVIHIFGLRKKFKLINRQDEEFVEEKEILKVEIEEKKEEVPQVQVSVQPTKIEPPQVTLLDEPVLDETLKRHGNLSKAEDITSTEAPKDNGGIKLVDLSKNDGPQDELTFNIFENLNEEDIRRMLEEDIDKEDK